MRKRAEEATPGPWHALKSGDGQECYVISRDYGQVATGMHDEPDAAEFVLIERDQRDADHIAAMHPLVAVALADWLEATAIGYETLAASPFGAAGAAFVAGFNDNHLDPAIAVARAYTDGAK